MASVLIDQGLVGTFRGVGTLAAAHSLNATSTPPR